MQNPKRQEISKPFSTPWQGVGFVFLVLFFLFLPVVLHLLNIPSRSAVYAGMDGRRSIGQFHYQEIFEKDTPVDIAIIGLSTLWVGLDAKYIEKKLGEKLGRKATVVTLGANHVGEDLVYVLARDLIQQRKVKMIILAPPPRRQNMPHPVIHRLIQWNVLTEGWQGLPFVEKARLYGLAVLGGPRQLISALRGDMQGDHRPYLREYNGAWIRKLGWQGENLPFVPKPLEPIPFDSEKFIHTREKKDAITFENIMSSYQRHFFKNTIKMIKTNGTDLFLLYVPVYHDRNSKKIMIRSSFEDIFGQNMKILGLPPQTLFNGMGEKELWDIFYNANHFNKNGAEFFTRTITPAILAVYG